MKVTYMPFTYLRESTARALNNLFGPVVVYQPLKTHIPDDLVLLSEQQLVEIRTPIDKNNERLHSALVEFTEWAKMNPGGGAAGADYSSNMQGEIPFFGETAVNRIRSEINRCLSPEIQPEESELVFSARLFLSVAQENDRAVNNLYQDLSKFKVLEKGFLSMMEGADEAKFKRRLPGDSIWQEDPGAKQTIQRIRAWATLAAADFPEMLLTTSPFVMETLLDIYGEEINLEKLIELQVPLSSGDDGPVLSEKLYKLAKDGNFSSSDLSSLTASITCPNSTEVVTVSLFAAINRKPVDVIHDLLPGKGDLRKRDAQSALCHTLIVLVEE